MLREKVFRVVSQIMDVPVEDVNESSSPENLEKWDSLQHMNLILALEEEFAVRFSDEDVFLIENVAIILEILENKGIEAAYA